MSIAAIVISIIAVTTAVAMLVLAQIAPESTPEAGLGLIDRPQAPASSPTPRPATEETRTIAAEAGAVAAALRAVGADWAAHITGVKVETRLRRPVVVISTDIGPEQADMSESIVSDITDHVSALTAPDGSRYSYAIEVRSSEGEAIGLLDSTDDRWSIETPPAPADVAALDAWLRAVYGPASPAPEDWVGRIKQLGSQPGDMGAAIVISTDLDPSAADDLAKAQTIIDAVNSSGATFAAEVRVIFSDGVTEWSSILTGEDPYRPRAE